MPPRTILSSHNFTDAEVAYCHAQPSSRASFVARWVGKEAVFKSLGILSRGAGAAMKEIEILPNEEDGVPEVTLHGDATLKAAAAAKGMKDSPMFRLFTIHCIACKHTPVAFSLHVPQ